MKVGIGLSLDSDPTKAAAEAVAQAKEAVPQPDLALVFGSIQYDQAKLHAELCRHLPPKILIGGSSYAEITNAGVSKGSVAVLLVSLPGAKIRFAQAQEFDPRQAGTALAKALDWRRDKASGFPTALLFAFTVLSSDDNRNNLIQGLTQALGRVPVFGGLTCGNYDLDFNDPTMWNNFQYCSQSLTQTSSCLALLDLPKEDYRVSFGFGHGWKPIAPAVELTRCKGPKVYEVGGMPIFDYYRQFLGEADSNDFFGQMIQRFGFSLLLEEEGGRSRVKLPIQCDFKEGCIHFAPAEDLQGRRVQLLQVSRLGLLQGAREAAQSCKAALDGWAPALVLVVSCCVRHGILHSRVDDEITAIRKVFGSSVPVFGYYSGGELAPVLNRYAEIVDGSSSLAGSFHHASSVGILALGCRKPATAVRMPSVMLSQSKKEDPAWIKRLLARSEEIQDTTESFLSNLSRKSYLDGERIRKQSEVIHRYTPHQVWERVGESVARGEFELPDSEFNGCFLFMDVKGFTSYSEEHKPGEVVSALNSIFKPATETIYSCGGDVDKFIGDCIFAVFSTPDEALTAGRKLLELFEKKGSPFMIRIGIHAGRAVRANVGSAGRREYTFIGDAVNTAQRLESNCTPGKLLVSEELFRQGTVKFPSQERKEIQVKGRKQLIAVVELGL